MSTTLTISDALAQVLGARREQPGLPQWMPTTLMIWDCLKTLCGR